MRAPRLLPALAVDHVGVADHSLAGSKLVRLLAERPPAGKEMPSGAHVARFGPAHMFELVVPARTGSPIERFLERRGPGLHHVALATEEPLEHLKTQLPEWELVAIGEIEPSSDGRPSLFLHPSSTGGLLIELVEGRR